MGGFIRTYMNKYDSDKLYDLRWSLVHYYSPHHFVLYHENNLSANIERHLSSSNRGILLHLGCSIRDLEGAVTRYRKDLESDDSLKMKAWKYYKKQYPIMPIKVEEIFSVNTAGGSFNQLTSLSTSGTVSPESWINPTS